MKEVGGCKAHLHTSSLRQPTSVGFSVLVIGRKGDNPGRDIINLNQNTGPYLSFNRALSQLNKYPQGIIKDINGKVVFHKGIADALLS